MRRRSFLKRIAAHVVVLPALRWVPEPQVTIDVEALKEAISMCYRALLTYGESAMMVTPDREWIEIHPDAYRVLADAGVPIVEMDLPPPKGTSIRITRRTP
jgi:hypothetical protein